ncbi:hypothetical protein CEXT_750841 [Caerostris extrusa]|uniref:Uncharacterized protein n=1 Tax=Caerostris extrusa TaxID=172846 RepID=A0AAV4P2R7_CAEEX|nr:hypothetical protein CEXT_750841 [Caerostris extrusa]
MDGNPLGLSGCSETGTFACRIRSPLIWELICGLSGCSETGTFACRIRSPLICGKCCHAREKTDRDARPSISMRCLS